MNIIIYKNNPDQTMTNEEIEEFETYLNELNLEACKVGDILYFSTHSATNFNDFKIIHISSTNRMVLEQI